MRLLGARAEVFHQPLGVVGVVAPWNFPFVLSLGALAGIFAAGNRAMLKPSEFTPATSALLKQLLDARFDADELATVLGDAQTGAAFTRLPFDHLLFTGAPSVARHVLRAAAENLVPVTLELGGKCPVIIGDDADMAGAVDRIMWGKTQNAGQICLAPDYVFVPRQRLEEFITLARAKITAWYPAASVAESFCSIINARHFERLGGYLDEARAAGVRIEALAAGNASTRCIPPTLLVEPDDQLAIMQDEIFGPLLPLKTYDRLDEAIAFVNARPRPLALYYFGNDARNITQIKERTTTGGITVNDIATHAAIETLPLGGIGNSGMGCYHGHNGFLNFSHAKAVFSQGRFNLARLFNPPYTDKQTKILDRLMGSMDRARR
jgi:coniferyl-aldehyde dehydrogenase